MSTVVEGDLALFTMTVEDGNTGLFPRVRVYDDAGAFVQAVDLSHVGFGKYQAPANATLPLGKYGLLFLVYTDAGHTVLSADYAQGDGQVTVIKATADDVWDEAIADHVLIGSTGEALLATAGHAGLHGVLDGGSGSPAIPHNTNNNLTTCRLRIFATKALADASTLGASDDADGELLRLNVDLANYMAGSLTAVPEVLTSIRRTSG